MTTCFLPSGLLLALLASLPFTNWLFSPWGVGLRLPQQHHRGRALSLPFLLLRGVGVARPEHPEPGVPRAAEPAAPSERRGVGRGLQAAAGGAGAAAGAGATEVAGGQGRGCPAAPAGDRRFPAGGKGPRERALPRTPGWARGSGHSQWSGRKDRAQAGLIPQAGAALSPTPCPSLQPATTGPSNAPLQPVLPLERGNGENPAIPMGRHPACSKQGNFRSPVHPKPASLSPALADLTPTSGRDRRPKQDPGKLVVS